MLLDLGSAETVILDGMAVREPLSTEDFESSFRSEDFSKDMTTKSFRIVVKLLLTAKWVQGILALTYGT